MNYSYHTKKWLSDMGDSYKVLTNFVDTRNQDAIRWLKWMGFSFVKIHRNYGIAGESFWEFTKKLSN